MKKIVLLIVLSVFCLQAGTVNFLGKTFNTVTYGGTESITLVEFATQTSSRFVWVGEKKKAILRYNNHTYVFTMANRTVVIDSGAIHLPLPVQWDGESIYIPVNTLEQIFNAQPTEIRQPQDIKIEQIILSGADPTTIKITSTGPISCEVTENSSSRVTLALPLGSNVSTIPASGLISSASLRNNNNRTTISLSLTKHCDVAARGITNGIEVTFTPKPVSVTPVITSNNTNSNLTIVVDPGHGGRDPGAVSRRGTRESDVNLDVSKRLKTLLEAQGHTVILTRSSDTYMSLADRTRFANQKKADIFISIHFNANNSSSPNGFETYFLGMHRLEYARDVALRENESLRYDMEANTYDPDETFNNIIASLLTNRFQRESQSLASYIQEAGSSSSGFSNRGLNQAGFYVLKGCSMPAVLVECGFLTNSAEEGKIRQPTYRQKIAEGIARGVSQYLSSL